MLIIDCHCHAGKGDGLTGPWDTNAPLNDFMRWSAEAGIQKTNLFAAFHSDYAIANAQVATIVKQNPEKFYGFAFIHAERDRGRVKNMVQKAVLDYGFCGIKAHRHDARISREICEVAQIFQIPVLYDIVGEVSTVELIAEEYPNVNFVIPHLGSFADDWRSQLALISCLERFPNVYTDTSGIRRFDILKKAFKRVGAGKILFGTDGPWLHPKVELSKIYALSSDADSLQKMLAYNFLQLISKVKKPVQSSPNIIQHQQPTFFSANYRDPWLSVDNFL